MVTGSLFLSIEPVIARRVWGPASGMLGLLFRSLSSVAIVKGPKRFRLKGLGFSVTIDSYCSHFGPQ